MSAKHVIPGIDDPTCGIAVAAKQLIARSVGVDGEVWVHSMWTPMVVKASFRALLTGKKLVRMPHGCTDPAKLRYHWHKKRWIAPIERWLFRHADRIIATCEDEVNWIKMFEPKVKKIELVPLASPIPHLFSSSCTIALANAEVSATAASSSLIPHPPSLKLLYVGRLHKLKGVNYLLDAIAKLANPQSVELHLIGKDEGESKPLKEQASRLNLNATFEGIVSEEAKNAAYDWCDVLVLPTLSENFGLVIAEALERGKRVITTDGAPAWRAYFEQHPDAGIYLKGYRDGTEETRVRMLADALKMFVE